MSGPGAPEGNDNAHKGAQWKQAIKRALAHKSGKTYREGLDLVATKFIEAAEQGDAWAIKDLADRIDGKPAQSLDIGGELNIPVSGTVKFVSKSE